jgi:hypothetical protein
VRPWEDEGPVTSLAVSCYSGACKTTTVSDKKHLCVRSAKVTGEYDPLSPRRAVEKHSLACETRYRCHLQGVTRSSEALRRRQRTWFELRPRARSGTDSDAPGRLRDSLLARLRSDQGKADRHAPGMSICRPLNCPCCLSCMFFRWGGTCWSGEDRSNRDPLSSTSPPRSPGDERKA